MSDEDDFMSDAFLVQNAATSKSKPKTYAERRQAAQRESERKQEENRRKSKRQLEQESRKAGLSQSLFDRAKEEEEHGLSKGPNKALAMMEKMGFKVGGSLGKLKTDERTNAGPGTTDDDVERKLQDMIEPLGVNEWTGKQGIGAGLKRARPPSPTSAERVAKMAKMAEQESHESFRDRTRQEYLQRRAHVQLVAIQRTCLLLDQKAGISFNVLWLSPNDASSFPEGLFDTIQTETNWAPPQPAVRDHTARLRQQMQADSLQPLSKDHNGDQAVPFKVDLQKFPDETVAEAAQFLSLTPRNRLELLVFYLRDKHLYCFWCGTSYDDDDEMGGTCPGEDEESHD